MVPKHSRCSSSLRTGETQVRDAVRRRVYSWRHRDYGLAGPQQRLSEVLSFRFLWRRWQRPPRICTHVLKHGVTRGLPRVCVCVCEHTRVSRVAQAVPVCVCTRVHHGSVCCVPGACTACGFSRGRQCRPRARFREEAQTEGVCFLGGAGRGHTSLPPPGEEYCSGNS